MQASGTEGSSVLFQKYPKNPIVYKKLENMFSLISRNYVHTLLESMLELLRKLQDDK